MPNRDGTGPQGKGPKTGRGMGCCGQSSTQSNQDQQHRSNGQGGCGRGQGKVPCGNMTQEDNTK